MNVGLASMINDRAPPVASQTALHVYLDRYRRHADLLFLALVYYTGPAKHEDENSAERS